MFVRVPAAEICESTFGLIESAISSETFAPEPGYRPVQVIVPDVGGLETLVCCAHAYP